MSGPSDWKPTTNIERAAEVIQAHLNNPGWYEQFTTWNAEGETIANLVAAEGLLVTDEQARLIEKGRVAEMLEREDERMFGTNPSARERYERGRRLIALGKELLAWRELTAERPESRIRNDALKLLDAIYAEAEQSRG